MARIKIDMEVGRRYKGSDGRYYVYDGEDIIEWLEGEPITKDYKAVMRMSYIAKLKSLDPAPLIPDKDTERGTRVRVRDYINHDWTEKVFFTINSVARKPFVVSNICHMKDTEIYHGYKFCEIVEE